MQNWDHVKVSYSSFPYKQPFFLFIKNVIYQFVLSHINKLPKESHDTDFSRIKSWYLDGQCVLPSSPQPTPS